MTALLVASARFPFADGNAGHVVDLGAAPAAGDVDVLLVGSVTVISSVAGGWTLDKSHLDQDHVQGLHRVCTGTEGTTFTVTTAGDFNTQALWQRWRGLAAFEVAAIAFSSGTSSPAAATGALAEAGELGVGMAFCSQNGSGNQAVSSWADSFTADAASGVLGSGALGTFAAGAYRTGLPQAGAAPACSWTGDAVSVATTVAWAFTVAPEPPADDDEPDASVHRRRRR